MQFHVVVRGRVQGVGFRWYVRESARSLGVAGWVRNRPDGAVEVAASGPDGLITSLRSVLGQGPQGASVASVDDLEPVHDSLPHPFTILK